MPCRPSAPCRSTWLAWDIDVMVSSSNKCIEGVPGFSYVLCKRDMLEASKGKCHSVVLDLYEQWKGLEQDRPVPLHAANPCAGRLPPGPEGARLNRVVSLAAGHAIARNAQVLVGGMRTMGFSTLARAMRKRARSFRHSSRRAIPISISRNSTRRCGCVALPFIRASSPSDRVSGSAPSARLTRR